jgi:hypothetical protein
MMADQQEALHRFHRVLVREVGSKYLGNPNASLTVQEIYYDLVPFQARHDELGVESMNEYEQTLLRLLAGHGGFLEMESIADRQRVQRHVDSRNSDPGIFREFLTAGVRFCSPVELKEPLSGDEKKDLPHFEDCLSCREPLPQETGVGFCPSCGSDLRRVPCVSCGEQLRLDWKFCVGCGTEVEPQRAPLRPH